MKILCLFPGQGSQERSVHERFAQSPYAAFAKEQELRLEQWLVQHADLEAVQPRIVGTSLWIWNVLQPFLQNHELFFSGHSLGELTASSLNLHWSYEDTLSLAYTRECLMKSLSQRYEGIEILALLGALDKNKIASFCDSSDGPWLMNDNGREQIVIGGFKGQKEKWEERKEECGIKKIVPIAMPVLSHCPPLKAIQPEFQQVLTNIQSQSPLILQKSSSSLQWLKEERKIKQNLVDQLSDRICFYDNILAFEGQVDCVVEVGPQQILTGLCKKIFTQTPVFSTQSWEKMEQFLSFMTIGESHVTME